jgi:phage baseplate assembly protein W
LSIMADAFHQWAGDLAIGPTGDIETVSGSLLGQQRLLRRLLTNPGDYIWQLDYGAGLARFIGQPANPLQIRAVIRSQIFKETAVARQPEPVIDVQIAPGGAAGTLYVYIRYVDAESGQTQALSFSVPA